jgi:hypothetical protein
MGRVISSENVRQAVFGKGFNPFALGIAPNLTGASAGAYSLNGSKRSWRKTRPPGTSARAAWSTFNPISLARHEQPALPMRPSIPVQR